MENRVRIDRRSLALRPRDQIRSILKEKYLRAGDPSDFLTEDISRLESVTEMAAALGIMIETEVVSLRSVPAEGVIMTRLNLQPDDPVYILERARRTNAETVIFSRAVISAEQLDADLCAKIHDSNRSIWILMEQAITTKAITPFCIPKIITAATNSTSTFFAGEGKPSFS